MQNAVETHEQTQVEALRALTEQIPLNDFGLPLGIYRTDFLPFNEYDPTAINGSAEIGLNGEPATPETTKPTNSHDKQIAVRRIAGFPASSLENAFVWLQYDEGFPAFEGGIPFWARLDFEPPKAHAVFQKYLQMHLGRKANEDDEEDFGESASGTRSIAQLATLTASDVDILVLQQEYRMYSHLYYWNMRANAYDLFRVTQHKKQQELRAIETQDEHYVTSKRLMNKLLNYMEDDEDFWGMMTPKTGIDMLKTLTQLERVSAGMPASGPAPVSDHVGGQSFEVAFRQVAQSNNPRVRKEAGEGEVLSKVLENPDDTETMQELVIRVNSRS